MSKTDARKLVANISHVGWTVMFWQEWIINTVLKDCLRFQTCTAKRFVK